MNKTRSHKDIDAYNSRAGTIYARLRETWEACVEDELLGAVVTRYRNSVQTHTLMQVSITDPDVFAIQAGMSKCSTWMLGHDKAKSLSENRPLPAELTADIQALRDFSGEIRKRWAQTRTSRNAKLKSP